MQPGQVVCRDDKPLTCGPDLISADEASACIGACKDGVCQAPACGDKKLEGLEECDDGNLLAGDGCSPTCTWEPIAIAVGEASSCALSGGGAVKCWGDNAHGVLGLGDTDPRGVKLGQMGSKLFEVALGTKRVAKAISVSGHTACALLDAGDVKCWGNNDSGQLGTGVFEDLGDARDEMGDKLKPVALGVGRSASAVSTGGNDTCAILDDGALKCWGSGADGELGQGNGTIQPLAAPLSGIILGSNRTAKIVSAGPHFITCAVLDDAASKCWGFGETGVLPGASNLGGGEIFGIGDFPGEMAALAPLTLGSNRTVKSISVGVDFACAILDDDTAKCWGENQSGQLGRGNMQATLDDPAAVAALPVVDLGTNHKVKSISVGDHHACAVLLDGRVKCWGNNEHGQLGIGSQINQGDYPGEMGELLNAVPLGRPALQVAAGQSHTCALLDDGSIKCWGLNDSGQLGVGSTISAGDTGGLAGVVLHTVDLAF
jgi:cysteine-rich repeat protein